MVEAYKPNRKLLLLILTPFGIAVYRCGPRGFYGNDLLLFARTEEFLSLRHVTSLHNELKSIFIKQIDDVIREIAPV